MWAEKVQDESGTSYDANQLGSAQRAMGTRQRVEEPPLAHLGAFEFKIKSANKGL